METRSQLSIKREEKRNSAKTLEFKNEVELFLKDKPDYISY